MISIRNDPRGRSWTISRPSGPNRSTQALATLVSIDEDGHPSVLGTAFVIYGHQDKAICVGASHSFEGIKQRFLQRSGRVDANVPVDFRPTGPVLFETNEVHAMVVVADEPIACKIIGYNAIENYDVCVFGLKAPDGFKPFDLKFALDLAVPQVGDEIAALVNQIELEPQRSGVSKLSQDFHLRHGVVTKVSWDHGDTSYLGGQRFVIKTTIPVEGGMSGSPLLQKTEQDDVMKACGVLSSNWPNREASESFHVAGDSTASMLWPAAGLFLPVTLEGSVNPKWALIGELLSAGYFDNRSSEVDVLAEGNSEKIEIWYCDRRPGLERTVNLTTTGHLFLD